MMLQIINLHKQFDQEIVLTHLSFELAANQVMSILGRSGSGKTTLLKILAGLEAPSEGQVILHGKDVTQVSPQKRNIVYLYQEPLLYPHLNVFDNIAFGLKIRKVNRKDIKERVIQMVTDLGLKGQEKKMPHQLSGGQRQRVNFGRAIIIEPQILLLDEPFGALDVETRHRMQELFQQLKERHQMTAIFVTHDLKEAILMGDRLAHMKAGKLNIYPNKAAFLSDPLTEASREMQFWAEMKDMTRS